MLAGSTPGASATCACGGGAGGSVVVGTTGRAVVGVGEAGGSVVDGTTGVVVVENGGVAGLSFWA